MLYEIKKYVSEQGFNEDAERRYKQTIADRTATSYDAFWKVEQVIKLPESYWWVLWSRPAPLRKH